jgi:hypothetical protein
MNMLGGPIAGPHRRVGVRVLWRSLLAAPFALSLVLTLVLGPATVDSRYGSFAWLAVLSLVATGLMLRAPGPLLLPVGLVAFLAFPLLVGLGFYFAPAWAQPAVGISFYGTVLAAAAAAVTGTVSGLRSLLRKRPGVRVVRAAGIGLLGLAAVVLGVASASANAATPAQGHPAGVTNLGSAINTGRREAEPSFTADGRTMYFNCDDFDVCVAQLDGTWEEARWTTPRVLGAPISTAYVEVEPSINAAGDRLYFNSRRPFASGGGMPGLALYVQGVGLVGAVAADGLGVSLLGGLGEDDVWVSELTDGVWSEPRNLADVPGEPPVNSPFKDHCLFFSADGHEAFWASTRPGGLGGNDLWTSRRTDGGWTAAENLGPTVNGPASDHHASPTPDGRWLYATSGRPGGFGGEDVYLTARGADGTWAELVNAGPPVNGPGDDRCPAWTPDGRVFLFDSDRAGGYGSKDLWWVPFADVERQPG